MTTFEPPSGHDDLAAQAEELRREREALEAERALVLQRRTEPEVIAPQGSTATESAPAAAPVGAVIDSAGQEFETDADGRAVLDGTGEPVPKGDYDRDENGRILFDGNGMPYPRWRYDVIEFKGRTVQVRTPQPAALQAFGMAVSPYAPKAVREKMWALFVSNHISERSYAELCEVMMDPDSGFTPQDFGELTRLIATQGTARPTGPSRA